MTEPGSRAQETLRGDILAVGIDDFVSMADVQGLIDDGGLAESAAECQRLVTDTVRSLLEEGLVRFRELDDPLGMSDALRALGNL